MATRIVEIEASEPLAAHELSDNMTQILGLVRWHGRPVGLIRVRATGSQVSPDQIETAIATQVTLPTCLEEKSSPSAESDAGERRWRTARRIVEPVSIIVCTRERPDELRLCLEALRPLASAGHEVIIVDNAPATDHTASLVKKYSYEYVREPVPGLNQARNRGIRVAAHEIVAFTDDDCAPDPGWVSALTVPYDDLEVGATTGLVMPLELTTLAQEHFEAYCANRRIFQSRRFRAPGIAPSAAGAVGLGANMSIRRRVLEQLGGFDVRFDGGTPTLSGGDTELFARLIASGAAIVYCPDALVWHRHRRDRAGVRRVIFGYGVGLYAVLTKRLLEDRDCGVLFTGPRWLVGPLLKAIWNGARGRPATPPDLLFLELWGALHGPLRYRAVRGRRLVRESRWRNSIATGGDDKSE